MVIELHIEELVLHGFEAGDRHRIAEALQNELARLIRARGVPAGSEPGFHRPRLDGGSFNVRTGESADDMGIRIGQAVYEGMAVNR